MSQPIMIEAIINSDLNTVWDYYNQPEHVVMWNHASDDWHTPRAENDLRSGGNFTYRMEARDGSSGFDFAGTYDEIIEKQLIRYTLGDHRKVEVTMKEENNQVKVTVTFDPENENDLEFQRAGWQAILDNFKNYVESN